MLETSMYIWKQAVRDEIEHELLPHLKKIQAALENLRAALEGDRRRKPKGSRAKQRTGKRLPPGHLRKCVNAITGGKKNFSPGEVVEQLMQRPEFRGRNRNSIYVQVCQLKAK